MNFQKIILIILLAGPAHAAFADTDATFTGTLKASTYASKDECTKHCKGKSCSQLPNGTWMCGDAFPMLW